MIKFRKAVLSDAGKLAEIRSIMLTDIANLSKSECNKIKIANKSYFDSALKDNSFVAWLALDGNNIIATSGLSFSVVPPFPGCLEGKVAYIMNMYTFFDYRRQGIGTELFKKIVEEAKNLGCKKITLSATEMGRKLYEKYGFKDVNNDMVYYVE